nr:unnamed protein product [Spirometra erinaceieuropaei]
MVHPDGLHPRWKAEVVVAHDERLFCADSKEEQAAVIEDTENVGTKLTSPGSMECVDAESRLIRLWHSRQKGVQDLVEFGPQ